MKAIMFEIQLCRGSLEGSVNARQTTEGIADVFTLYKNLNMNGKAPYNVRDLRWSIGKGYKSIVVIIDCNNVEHYDKTYCGLEDKLIEYFASQVANVASISPLTFNEMRIEALTDRIMFHRYCYYVLNNPRITDQEYDLLEKELINLEEATDGHPKQSSPSQTVGSDNKLHYPLKIRDYADGY